ncbi:MAG: HAD-IIA family hydrolase [Phycisphaerae bacterium]|jgi:ribonucleotide monophosphatase NagD (HAD superfamily)
MLSIPKLVLFDLDGTIYISGKLIYGTKELLLKLSDSGINYGFMTNNSSVNPDDYLDKLCKIGLPAVKQNIITSCQATILMLKEFKLGRNLYIVGTERFKKYLAENQYYHDAESPSAVLVGFDLELTFEKLTQAVRFLTNGVPLFASHPDTVCPSSAGPIPDAGMVLAALLAGSGVQPTAIAGKPYKWILQVAQQQFNVGSDETVIVGDRLATDILMANKFGMKSALVLSGVSKISDIEKFTHKPDVIVDSVEQLIDKYWFGTPVWAQRYE